MLKKKEVFKKTETYLKNLINGKAHNFSGRFVLVLLSLLERVYYVLIYIRNFLYHRGIFSIKRLSPRIISVGNITVGGTGKTPLVEKTARDLSRAGEKVVIVSRGYKSSADCPVVVSDGKEVFLDPEEAGDEAYMLARKLAGIPVIIGKDRYQAGVLACRKFSPEIIILDDGFQYRGLYRDEDIVIIDGLCPFGYNRLLPRGYLREPLSSLDRAHKFIISHKKHITQKTYNNIAEKLRKYNSRAPITGACIKAEALEPLRNYASSAEEQETSVSFRDIKGKKIVAAAGIGSPSSFLAELTNLGARVAHQEIFSDHHNYCLQDIRLLFTEASKRNIQWIITTEKDAVKLADLVFEKKQDFQLDEKVRFLVLTVQMQID